MSAQRLHNRFLELLDGYSQAVAARTARMRDKGDLVFANVPEGGSPEKRKNEIAIAEAELERADFAQDAARDRLMHFVEGTFAALDYDP